MAVTAFSPFLSKRLAIRSLQIWTSHHSILTSPCADVEVTFVSEDVEVNEDSGTVTVCMRRNVLTKDPLNVPIAIAQGSADSELFTILDT